MFHFRWTATMSNTFSDSSKTTFFGLLPTLTAKKYQSQPWLDLNNSGKSPSTFSLPDVCTQCFFVSIEAFWVYRLKGIMRRAQKSKGLSAQIPQTRAEQWDESWNRVAHRHKGTRSRFYVCGWKAGLVILKQVLQRSRPQWHWIPDSCMHVPRNQWKTEM